MYRCDACQQAIGPKVPQVAIVEETRSRDYINEVKRTDVETGKVTTETVYSVGTEIVAESHVCPPCAGTTVPVPAILDRDHWRMLAKGFHEHVRGCDGTAKRKGRDGKRIIEPCGFCTRIIKEWASFPPAMLSEVLGEAPAKRFTYRGK